MTITETAESPAESHGVPLLTAHIADPNRDMDDVARVLNSAAQWLTEQGIDQWPASFDEDGGWRLDKLRDEAQRGHVFLLTWGQGQGRIPLATATVTDWADPDFAQAWPDGPRNALYLMRLAVTPAARTLARKYGRPGLGEMLINIAKDNVRYSGRRYLRLDCSRENTKLHAYYERLGFVRVGTVEVGTRRSGALYQLDTVA